jgi:hypothetical protein
MQPFEQARIEEGEEAHRIERKIVERGAQNPIERTEGKQGGNQQVDALRRRAADAGGKGRRPEGVTAGEIEQPVEPGRDRSRPADPDGFRREHCIEQKRKQKPQMQVPRARLAGPPPQAFADIAMETDRLAEIAEDQPPRDGNQQDERCDQRIDENVAPVGDKAAQVGTRGDIGSEIAGNGEEGGHPEQVARIADDLEYRLVTDR